MPAHKKEDARIVPPLGSKSYPAYKVKRPGRAVMYRFTIIRPNAAPEHVEFESLAEIKFARAESERTLKEHADLTFEKAIPLYFSSYVDGSGMREGSRRTLKDRLRGFFEPVLKMPVVRLTPEKGYVLYMGKVAPKLGPDGKPVVIEQGYIHRPTKRPRSRLAAPADRTGRGPGKISGRYAGIGPRSQVCQTCGQSGHNRRAHGKSKPDERAPLILDAATRATGARPDWYKLGRGKRGRAEMRARDAAIAAMLAAGWTETEIVIALGTDRDRAVGYIERAKASAEAATIGRNIVNQLGERLRKPEPEGEPAAAKAEAAAPDEERFPPPSVETHQAALREAKRFCAWLVQEGHLVPNKDGKHPLEHVKPYGRRPEGGFGKAHLTDEELIELDRTCVRMLESLAAFPEQHRLAWQQRAVAVLMAFRCGARKGELITARRRQFTIIRKTCAQMIPACAVDHGGHVAGQLQVVRENAKTGTSVRTLPIGPSLMKYVLPLLEGKGFEQYFLAGAPRGESGYGMAAANWERDPNVGLSENWFNNALEKLCDLAGIRRENPHGLRGAYVDSRVARGDAFAEVSRDAGHGTNTRTTERHYANEIVLAEAEQRRMLERLGYSAEGGIN